MSFTLRFLTFGCALILVGGAQDTPKKPKDPQAAFEPRSGPGVGQKFLQKLAGDFEVQKTFFPKSGEPFRSKGECKQRMIHDGRFLQRDFTFEIKNGRSTGQGLIGFETDSGKFTSVWTDARATRMSFRQSQDKFNGEEIVLYGKALDGAAKGPSKSRTVTRLEDDGKKIVHRQFAIDAEGNERPVMELILTRKKQ